MNDFKTLLISAPAAAFLVVGIYIAVKLTSKKCPAKDHMDDQTRTVNEHLAKHAESIKSIAVSIDKNTDTVKDVIRSQGEMVERLTNTLLQRSQQ